MSACPECNHPAHADDECVAIVGYDHLNGDHECGCPGSTRDEEHPADEGHRFTIAMTSRGSSKVVGEAHHTSRVTEPFTWTDEQMAGIWARAKAQAERLALQAEPDHRTGARDRKGGRPDLHDIWPHVEIRRER